MNEINNTHAAPKAAFSIPRTPAAIRSAVRRGRISDEFVQQVREDLTDKRMFGGEGCLAAAAQREWDNCRIAGKRIAKADRSALLACGCVMTPWADLAARIRPKAAGPFARAERISLRRAADCVKAANLAARQQRFSQATCIVFADVQEPKVIKAIKAHSVSKSGIWGSTAMARKWWSTYTYVPQVCVVEIPVAWRKTPVPAAALHTATP